MIPFVENLVMLQSGGFYGGSLGNLLLYWEQSGFFAYALPFLLIFALVFGILTKVNMFPNNRALNAVIAAAVGLISLQFGFVSIFFSEIFPRVGIGLGVILALFILIGLFLPQKTNSGVNWLLLAAGLVVFFVVLTRTFGYLGYDSGIWYFVQTNFGAILTVVIVLALLGAIINAGKELKPPVMPQQNWQGVAH